MTKVTNSGVESCGSGHFALKSSRSKGKSLKSNGFEAFKWQREKDSNPHIRSQSPLCYLYTIPLNAKAIIQNYFRLSRIFFSRRASFSAPAGRKAGTSFDREQPHALHAADGFKRTRQRVDGAGHGADVDRERHARLAEYRQTLRDRKNTGPRTEETRENGA